MKAILLAAGAGRKMWPYSETRQKGALPIGNVPAIRLLADDLLALGVEGIVVGIGTMAGSIRHALHGLPESKVAYFDASRCNGTAEAALRGIEAVGDDPDGWLVVCADLLCPRENLAALRDAFVGVDAAALVAPLAGEDPRDWLCASIDSGRLAGIEGHPREGTHRLCGVWALGPAALPALRDNPGVLRHVPVGGMPPVESELAESIQMLIDAGREVAAVVCPEVFVDLDKPWHILEASRKRLDYRAARLERDIIPASCRISDGAEIDGRLCLGEGVQIGRRAVIRGALFAGEGAQLTNGPILNGAVALGREVKVRDYALLEGGTVCGERGIFGHGSEFCGVAFDNVYLYHYCEIYGVLGSSVDIGGATICGTLRFDDRDGAMQVAGRREFPRDGGSASYLGDHTRTGVNAILMPGRKVGCWSCVGPGLIVDEDIPSRKVVLVKQERVTRPWGPEKYGW